MTGVLLEIAMWNALTATLLAFAVIGMSKIWRHPVLIHNLWILVLLKLVMPPLVPFELPAVLEEVGSSNIVGLTAQKSVPQFEEKNSSTTGFLELNLSWSQALLLLWLAGSGVVFMVVVIRVYRFHRFLVCNRKQPKELLAQAEKLSKLMGLTRCPDIWVVPAKVSPMLVGIFSRKIILPRDLVNNLDDDARTTLLAHELVHVKQRDYLVRLLEVLTMVLFWWHPVVWLSCHKIRETEELRCDLFVVQLMPNSAKVYADALIDTVDFLSCERFRLPVTVSGITFKNSLKRRVAMIMRASTQKPVPISGCFVAFLIGLTLFVSPVWAENQPETSQASQEVMVQNQQQTEPQETEKEIEKALNEADIEKEIEKVLQERNIEKIVEEALEEAQIEATVEKALEEANVEEAIEKALQGTELGKAPTEVDIPKIIGEALSKINVGQIVEEALRAVNVGELVQMVLAEIDIGEFVQTSLEQANVEKIVEEAMQEAETAIAKAKKRFEEAETQINEALDNVEKESAK